MLVWCGVVYMWCRLHVMCEVLCTCGIVYAIQWCSVHMALCTHCVGGVVHMWCSTHVVQVVLSTCGIGGCVGLSACCTCYVVGMWYYVCALCSHGIMIYAFIMLRSRHIFVLCCTSGVGACIVFYSRCRHMYELCCIPSVCTCIFWCRMLCVDECLVMYIMHICVCTLGVGVCVVRKYRCRCCMVLYGMCGCMCLMHTMRMFTSWRRRH